MKKDKPLKNKPANPLTPSATLLVKLGSIAVHAEEFHSPDGHVYDKVAMEQLLADPEVRDWIARMDALAFLPKKRKP